MSKPRKKQGNPDFRHRVSVPAPASKEIESRLFELISPGTFTNLKGSKDKERSLRSRILTPPDIASTIRCHRAHLNQALTSAVTVFLPYAPKSAGINKIQKTL